MLSYLTAMVYNKKKSRGFPGSYAVLPLVDKGRQTDNVAHRSDAIVSEVDDLVAVVERPLTIRTLDALFHHRVSGVFSQLDNLEGFAH